MSYSQTPILARNSQFEPLELNHQGLLNADFQYVEIDEAVIEELRKQDLRPPLGKKVALDKWCVDRNHPIALLYLGWVSSTIARMDDGLSLWQFLLIANGVQAHIELYRQRLSIDAEIHPILPNELRIDSGFATARFLEVEERKWTVFSKECGFGVEELKQAVCAAIRVYDIGWHYDYHEECKQRELERAKVTRYTIRHGEFSTMLRRCIDSIVEIKDMEQIFRTVCLKHFENHNMAVQHFGRGVSEILCVRRG